MVEKGALFQTYDTLTGTSCNWFREILLMNGDSSDAHSVIQTVDDHRYFLFLFFFSLTWPRKDEREREDTESILYASVLFLTSPKTEIAMVQ